MDPDTASSKLPDEQGFFHPEEALPNTAGSSGEHPGEASSQEVEGRAHKVSATSGKESITWSAAEFVLHQKSLEWYGLLASAAVAIAAITWLLTRDIFPTLTVLISILLLGIYAARKPQEQTYKLDGHSITIGHRTIALSNFRSFYVMPEGSLWSAELAPLKRFATYTTIYFHPKDQDVIMGLLSSHLPMEEPHKSIADSLMRRIHF